MPIWIGRVRYIDHGSVTDRIPHEFNLYGPVLAKSLDFQHEDEVRAIYWDIPTLDMARGLAERPIGFNVPVDIGALVQSVVISPFASPRFVAKVRKTCALFGWGDLPIESSGAVS
jgi:hypothetical protein